MHLIVLPGDGIGPEISEATLTILQAASERFQLGLVLEEDLVGHASFARHGTTVVPELLDRVKAADGLILGPTATFEFGDAAKGGVNPSAFFRKGLDLYANIRPSRTYPGVKSPVGEFDLTIVRENTEGFYADRTMFVGNADILVTEDVGISIRKITRKGCERIAHEAFRLARRSRNHVTAVHKANVLKQTDGLFLGICRQVASEYPDVAFDERIIDAMAALLVRTPQSFDVVVTTNMFGDILSDLAAELSGSIGLGGSLNAGSEYAMAQAAHGSAPDIAGQDKANPFSLVLSTAMLLGWHGDRKGQPRFGQAAAAIETAVRDAVAAGEATGDVGGRLGTIATGAALAKRLRAD